MVPQILAGLYFSFSFVHQKRKKSTKRKRKNGCFLCPDGYWGGKYILAANARPASRFSYARYGCLRTTLAACALYYLVFSLQASRLPSPRGRVRVGASFSRSILEPKHHLFLTFTPNVTQYVLCYITGNCLRCAGCKFLHR